MHRELLIGCGHDRGKHISSPAEKTEWSNLTTLDVDPNVGADVEHDLRRLPLPFDDETFDEIHAYHVLQCYGAQGDKAAFFLEWSEYWRLLKPGGLFIGIVPGTGSPWVFGDPGHTRFISPYNFAYLAQPEYARQVARSRFSDYRSLYKADFDLMYGELKGDPAAQDYNFVLKAVKPSRINNQGIGS